MQDAAAARRDAQLQVPVLTYRRKAFRDRSALPAAPRAVGGARTYGVAVDTAVWVALITSVSSLCIAGLSLRSQRSASREVSERESRSQARRVLDSYRGPLLSAGSELGDRIDNIRHRSFTAFADPDSGRQEQARLTTLFRFAQFFGWREVLRTEVQLLRFEDTADTQLAAALIGDVVWAFASDALDGERAMLWSEEQRAIGELMVASSENGSSRCIGYATFASKYDERFAPWMDGIAAELLAPGAPQSDRLRVIQWALCGLVAHLDEERTQQDRPWIERSRSEAQGATGKPLSRIEEQVLAHLRATAQR